MIIRKLTGSAVLVLLCVFSAFSQDSQTNYHDLMPVPASLRFNSGGLAVTPSFTIAVKGHSDARLIAAIDRMARKLEAHTGLTFARGLASDADAAMIVQPVMELVIAAVDPAKARARSAEEWEKYVKSLVEAKRKQ